MVQVLTRPGEGLASDRPSIVTGLYRAVWRWHFYAGIFVAPFLLVLAVTGLIMVYGNSIETFLGKKYHVSPGGERLSVVQQGLAAQAAFPDSMVTMFVSPATDDRASVFLVNADNVDYVVSVDPHDGKVLGTVAKNETWFYWANKIHGTLLLGDIGDRLQETAAGLGIALLLSGLYLWWPRNGKGPGQVLVPNLARRGRGLVKELHVTAGFYISVVLLLFLISGLAWSGVWGAKIVQAWSTLPPAKLKGVPLSDKTHASLNHGPLKEVPWALEQTPLPASGSSAGIPAIPSGAPVNLNTVTAFAKTIGFTQQFRINLPSGDDGVYTISADSMDADTNDPMGDHTVHLDQYTGKILADIRFTDYSLSGKAMAVGIALHEGTMGLWNTILNTAYCFTVIFMVLSGIVMWWLRRPAGALGAPRYPRDYRIPRAILGIAIAVSLAFPLTGIAIVVFALIDFLLPKRFKEAGFQYS